MSESALLRFDAVSCMRGGRLLFEDLDLELGPGDACLVTGPNGAGKSSLLRLAAGLLGPSAGRVVRSDPVAAFADDKLALDPRATLGAAIGFWARIDGARADAAMDAWGLASLADVPVRMLSAGQRKRSALARATASGARLWLLDEPGNGLDSDGLERLADAMAGHRAGGGAILAASHGPIGLDRARTVAL